VTGHRPEVADVLREHGATYQASHGASADQRRVVSDLTRCRTAALGGHVSRCTECEHEEISYNSCRNRHCPKCQGTAAARWLEARESELLEVGYFHVVFTLPAEIGPLALQNRRVVYGLLFRAVSQTLRTIARDPRHLGAEIGILCVLHTWGQNLHHHPHVHCVVPGGGLSPDGDRWVPSRARFLLSVRVLRDHFRGCFLRHLDRAFRQDELEFHGELAWLAQQAQWRAWLRSLHRRRWVVYAKPPFGGPQQVLRYLARYTHRVAISNQRILSVDQGRVRFHWKDYRRGGARRVMTLEADEFVRRFLLHVLPKGFQRIRQYGFLANRVKSEKLVECRKLLAVAAECRTGRTAPCAEPSAHVPISRCPVCGKGTMQVVAEIKPSTAARAPPSELHGSMRRLVA